MGTHEHDLPDPADEGLALLVEELLARAQSGAALDVDAVCAEHPAHADALRDLLPSLLALEVAAHADGASPLALERIGPYRLERVLGRGGMGVVYLAEDEELGRPVALKLLPRHSSADPAFLARFRREAHVAALLEHPGIVRVYGVGQDAGQWYYAMQFVDGCSLDRLVAFVARSTAGARPGDAPQGSSDLRALVTDVLGEAPSEGAREHGGPHVGWGPIEAARIARDVAAALAFAHAQGVVHRDVKPGNILLDRDGHALVADFGLCRLEDGSAASGGSGVVGTLRYMAPEQLDGVATPRSDVYGVGLVLYELLTLRSAFPETQRGQLVKLVHAGRVLRVRRLAPDVPRDLETIVLKATSRLPDERYATAAELAADLGAFLDVRPIQARPPTALYLLRLAVRRNPLAALLLVCAVLVLSLGAWRYLTDVGEERELRRQRSYVAGVSAANAALRVGAVSEARRRLDAAPPEERSWEWRHLLATADQAVVTCIPTGEPLRDVAMSPTGDVIAVVSATEVALIDPRDGAVLARAPLEGGQRLAFRTQPRPGLIVLETRHVVEFDPLTLELRDRREAPHWGEFAPVGSELWVTRLFGAEVFDPESGELRPAGGPGTTLRGVGCIGAATGWVLSVDGQLWIDDGRDEVIALPVGQTRVTTASFDAGGGRVAVALESGSVLVYDLAQRRVLHSLRGHDGPVLDVRFLDDARLVSAGSDNLLRVWDLERGLELARLSGHARSPVALACDPLHDVVASIDHGGALHVWQPRFGGGGGLLGTHDWDPNDVRFSASGRLAVSCARDGTVRVWDLLRMEPLRVWTDPEEPVSAAWFGPDDETVVALDWAGEIWTWSVGDGALVGRVATDAGPFVTGTPTRDGRRIIASATDRLLVLDARTLVLERDVPLAGRRAYHVTAGLDERIHVGCTDGSLDCLELGTGRLAWSLPPRGRGVGSLALDSTGERLAVAWGLGRALVLDARTGRTLREYAADGGGPGGGGESLLRVAFGAGGRRLFAGTSGGTLIVWDADDGECLAHLDRHKTSIYALASDGERLLSISGGFAAEVRLWDSLDARARWADAQAFAPVGSPAARAEHARLATLRGRLAWCVEQLDDPAGQRRAAARLAISIYINVGLTGETAVAGGLACIERGEEQRGLVALRRATELLPPDHPWQPIAARVLAEH